MIIDNVYTNELTFELSIDGLTDINSGESKKCVFVLE